MTDAEFLKRFNTEYWQTLKDGGVPALSRLQRDALCIMSFQGEINDGGMHQYLLNSSGDLAKETPDVLKRIGADAAAEILERANDYFGPIGPPVDRDTRVEMLLALPEDKQQQIHDLTDDFYDAEDQGLCLADLFDAYVLSHRST
ncbi:MAG: DMP19 family protein [Pirellulaceae bacterium]